MSRLAPIRRGRSVSAKISGGRGRPWKYFLVSTKLDILLSDSANCTVLRAVVFTQYRRVTDGRNCRSYSTALAMRALGRAVKMSHSVNVNEASLLSVPCTALTLLVLQQEGQKSARIILKGFIRGNLVQLID